MQYIGTLLPEPIVAGEERSLQQYNFEQSNLLCYELAFLMEQLSPTERAVFVLREAFDFGHKEIAEAINISADNSRQLYKRAKEKVANLKHKSVSVSASLDVAQKFVSIINRGNIEQLIAVFNDDISIIGDGGGKAPTITASMYLSAAFPKIDETKRPKKNTTPRMLILLTIFTPAGLLSKTK